MTAQHGFDRREFIKVAGGSLLLGSAGAYGAHLLAPSVVGEAAPPSGKKWETTFFCK